MKLITKFAIIIALSTAVISCTDPKGSTKALIDAGYHPIKVGGYGFFKCDEKDVFSTNFKAFSPDSSRIVTGCVCKGWFKGKTIRLD